MLRCFASLCAVLLFLCVGDSSAQAVEEEKERTVVEIGAGAFRSITDSANSFGPSVAVEVAPTKNWLELEFGTTASFRRHFTEWGDSELNSLTYDIIRRIRP